MTVDYCKDFVKETCYQLLKILSNGLSSWLWNEQNIWYTPCSKLAYWLCTVHWVLFSVSWRGSSSCSSMSWWWGHRWCVWSWTKHGWHDGARLLKRRELKCTHCPWWVCCIHLLWFWAFQPVHTTLREEKKGEKRIMGLDNQSIVKKTLEKTNFKTVPRVLIPRDFHAAVYWQIHLTTVHTCNLVRSHP